MLSINQVLQQGRYHITNRIEHEETGVTYQAFDNVLQTNVIIKETSFDLKSSPNPYKYPIAKQMENLISIKHESFTQIHGFFSEVDHQYLVTESVEGQNLKKLLEVNGRPFPLFTVLTWTEQLLDALNYLHSKIPPIIHRDVTPTNLTLTGDNKIKLLTYPIIKEFNPQKGTRQTEASDHSSCLFCRSRFSGKHSITLRKRLFLIVTTSLRPKSWSRRSTKGAIFMPSERRSII
jgi:serine/threonine protein kinase